MATPKKRGPKRKPRPKPKEIILPTNAELEARPAETGVLPEKLRVDLAKLSAPVTEADAVPVQVKPVAPGDLAEPLDPSDPSDKNRSNWSLNHGLILDAMDKYLRQYKRFPSYVALARITGLDPGTVKDHFDKYDWTRVRKKAQLLTEKLVYEMYEAIRSGKVKKSMVNLYFKIINQWRDGIDINVHNQYDFRILAEKVQTADNAGDRTRNFVSFLSGINGRMDSASIRSN